MTTAVIGGGLAGALAARSLQLGGEDVIVVDAGARAGGVAVPIRRDGYLLEPAAGSLLLPHPHLSPLLDGLDLNLRPATPAARSRFVLHRGVTVRVEPGPRILATPLLSTTAKARLMAEPFIRSKSDPDETLERFLVRRLGRDAGHLIAGLMAGGVHGGDADELAVGAAFPRLAALEAQHGSLLRGMWANRKARSPVRPSTHVIDGGIATVASAVADLLGDRWMPEWTVEHLEVSGSRWRIHGPEALEADQVVAAISPESLAKIFSPAQTLADAEWSPVAVVFLGLTGPELPDGIGVLVGPDEGFDTLGFLFESSYDPARAPSERGLVKAIVGGGRRPGVTELADDQLVSKVTAELEVVLGEGADVEMSHVVRRSIPQYTPTRRRMIEVLPSVLPAGLRVCGWAYDGVGVTNLATGAVNLHP